MTEEFNTLDPFNKKYPIVQKPLEGNSLEYTVYLLDEIGDPREFAEIITLLDNAFVGDVVIIKLATPGGRADTTGMLIDAFKNTDAQVVAEVVGDTASAGTILALSCHGLYVAEHVEFMCHFYSAGIYGKGNEIEARSDFMKRSSRELIRAAYSKFLTKKEIQRLIKGEDFYFGKEEVEQRWEKVVNYKIKQQEKEQKAMEDENDEGMIAYLAEKGYSLA